MITPKMNSNLSNIFDIELQETEKPIAAIKADAKAAEIDSLEKQRDYVRSNLVKLIEHGMNSLNDLTVIANSSEKSRDFEVMSTLIKTLVDTNIELLNAEVAHKPKMQVNSQEAGTINNNTVFVGSTKDLAAYLSNNPNVVNG